MDMDMDGHGQVRACNEEPWLEHLGLTALRIEALRLKRELDNALQFKEKYHAAVNEVTKLREQLERLEQHTPSSKTPTESKNLNGQTQQLQLQNVLPSPDRNSVNMEPQTPAVVKQDFPPIKIEEREVPILTDLKNEKKEEDVSAIIPSIKKEEEEEHKSSHITRNEDTLAANGSFHEDETRLSSVPEEHNLRTAQTPTRRGTRQRPAVRAKREHSVIVISSDDDAQRPVKQRRHVVKVEDDNASLTVSPLTRGRTQQPTIQVKKEEKPDIFIDEAAFAPIQGVLDMYPHGKVSPKILSHHPIPRELISYAWGGGTQVVFAKTGKEKRRENEEAGRIVVHEYVGLSRVWNPRLPTHAGKHGVAYVGCDEFTQGTEPRPLFVREDAWKWRYLGHYTFEVCPTEFNGETCTREFNGELWDRLSQQTKSVWLNGFVKAGWGSDARAKIRLRRQQLGRESGSHAIENSTGPVTEEEVAKALSEKLISIGISLVKFHYYSDEHYESLVSREEEEKYLEALDRQKNPKSRKGGSNTGSPKKRKVLDFQRKGGRPKKTRHEARDSSDDEEASNGSDEEYVPTRVGESKAIGRHTTRQGAGR